MHDPLKLCPACGAQNNLSAAICQNCGMRYTDSAPLPATPAQPKRSYTLTTLFGLIVAVFGCCIFSNFIAKLTPSRTPPSDVATTNSPTPVGSPEVSATPNAWVYLTVVKSDWEKGGFGSIAVWKVRFKNNSDRPIGNIQYRTEYYSETGNVVDKGGVDSLLDKKVVQKVIPPKSTRTIEINDGFVHSEAHRARFQLVDAQFVTDSR